MAYYRQCTRCGGTMDPGEGLNYPGEGLVCEECAEKLDREEACRKRRSLSGERMREQLDKLPGIRETA